MTRINVVPPKLLTNVHLMAEYRELPRIFTAVKKLYSENKKVEAEDLPKEYCLGAGHVKFFYNKLLWLAIRYYDLYQELLQRGFNLNKDLFHKIIRDTQVFINEHKELNTHFHVKPEDYYLNMARLAKRSGIKIVEEELVNGK